MLDNKRIGFVSTRLAGTDGVSLEAKKWMTVLERQGHECFCFGGELDCPHDHEYIAPEAHFAHPEIEAVQTVLFGTHMRGDEVTRAILDLAGRIKQHLYGFLDTYRPDVLVVQNALAIPMNIPLGIALTEFITETSIPAIAHHHDFYWERERFLHNAASDYLRMAFPPTIPSLRHVTINSIAAQELGHRAGVSSIVIPNVMDFAHPPHTQQRSRHAFRQTFGIADDELVVLQPTRIVKRKRIEQAIDLVRRLDTHATLMVTHPAGDEGLEYEEWLREYAELVNVRVLFVADRVNENGTRSGGSFSLEDMYHHADLVTYPSRHEGFGNAFVEAVYYKKPILVNRYPIYQIDIAPKGFHTVEIDELVTAHSLDAIHEVLDDESLRQEMMDHNYTLAKRYFSYEVLEHRLTFLLADLFGVS